MNLCGSGSIGVDTETHQLTIGAGVPGKQVNDAALNYSCLRAISFRCGGSFFDRHIYARLELQMYHSVLEVGRKLLGLAHTTSSRHSTGNGSDRHSSISSQLTLVDSRSHSEFVPELILKPSPLPLLGASMALYLEVRLAETFITIKCQVPTSRIRSIHHALIDVLWTCTPAEIFYHCAIWDYHFLARKALNVKTVCIDTFSNLCTSRHHGRCGTL